MNGALVRNHVLLWFPFAKAHLLPFRNLPERISCYLILTTHLHKQPCKAAGAEPPWNRPGRSGEGGVGGCWGWQPLETIRGLSEIQDLIVPVLSDP